MPEICMEKERKLYQSLQRTRSSETICSQNGTKVRNVITYIALLPSVFPFHPVLRHHIWFAKDLQGLNLLNAFFRLFLPCRTLRLLFPLYIYNSAPNHGLKHAYLSLSLCLKMTLQFTELLAICLYSLPYFYNLHLTSFLYR